MSALLIFGNGWVFVRCRIFRRSHPLPDASSIQLLPTVPYPHPVVTTKNISRHCRMTRRGPNWPCLQPTGLNKALPCGLWLLCPTCPTPLPFSFSKPPSSFCLSALHMMFSLPGILFSLFRGRLLFFSPLDFSFQRDRLWPYLISLSHWNRFLSQNLTQFDFF